MGVINTVTNNLGGTITGGVDGIYASGLRITSLTNDGSINGAGHAGINILMPVNSINNNINGGISGSQYGILMNNGVSVNSIVNLGAISGNNSGIDNTSGYITKLDNLQGSNNPAGALTYKGRLPSFYNIVISTTGYGQLILSAPTEKMTFNISTLSTNVAPGTKTNVVRGATAANFTSLSGTFTQGNQKFSFRLNNPNAANDWDLIIDYLGLLGPDVWNTYKTLASNRDALLGAMHQRYAVLNTVMEYDCSRFDKYGVCISFQARSTGWGTQTTGAGVLNIAYRIHPKIRAGAYLDYQVAQGTTFGTNYGTGGIQNGFNNPTFGGYVGYTQDKDGTGLQARASGGYNSGKITITRALLENTEAGSGNAALNAYYAFGTFGYGIKIAENSIVAPYSGLLYTNIIRNSYTENYNALVLYPLAYNSFYEQLITGVGGLKLTSMLTDKLGCQFGIGAQLDIKRTANGYGGYSYIPGMEAYGIAHGGSWNGKRPTAQAGAFYNVSKNEQLVINAYAGQQAFTTRTYTSLLAGYQISF